MSSNIPLWIRFLLLFKSTHVSYDIGSPKDDGCLILSKRLFGVTYILQEKWLNEAQGKKE